MHGTLHAFEQVISLQFLCDRTPTSYRYLIPHFFHFSDWLSVKVKGYSLDRAINCWISKDVLTNTTPSPNLTSAHCKSVLIDDCSLPQCNSRCPAPRNPFTGELLVTPTTRSPSQRMPGVQNDQNQKQNIG